MSFATVFRDDFKNTRRSYVVLGVIATLTGFVSLITYSVAEFHDDAFRALFDVSFFFFLVFPLILVPLTYLSVAGDREHGSIKHTLGLPNTRAEYVLGKYVSRTAVALGAVLASVLAALLIGLGMYDGSVDVARFATFAAITGLFVASMTAIFVACSTLTSRRSRAMFGVIGLYFLLGPFWLGFLPVVSLQTVVTTVADLFGATVSESTRGWITAASPTTAYLSGLEPVYDGVIGSGDYPRVTRNYAVEGSREIYQENWFNYATMTAWGVVALAASYARFRVAELG
ncbi:ABC transporter permease [Halorubellus litoreus]|uniref:ABC transporter permease n=1 Tax=Halorubellus litoreus TaxID=755308 RepID=A0ABD5VF52_9EURY